MKIPVRYVEFTAKGVVTLQTEEITTDELAPWEVVVQNEATLISAGTELAGLYGVEPVQSIHRVQAMRRLADWLPKARP